MSICKRYGDPIQGKVFMMGMIRGSSEAKPKWSECSPVSISKHRALVQKNEESTTWFTRRM